MLHSVGLQQGQRAGLQSLGFKQGIPDVQHCRYRSLQVFVANGARVRQSFGLEPIQLLRWLSSSQRGVQHEAEQQRYR